MSWDLIVHMKHTDPYLVVRQSTKSGEFIEHRDDLTIKETNKFIDLCDYVEEEKSGIKYIIAIVSELTLTQIREEGTPTYQFIQSIKISLRRTSIMEATTSIGWLEGVGEVNSQPNVERTIAKFFGNKLDEDIPI